MRFKKTEQRSVVVYSRTTCDICGERTDLTEEDAHNDIDIEARIGKVYDEYDSRDYYELDICARCFLEKVKPAIEALGCKFRERSSLEDGRVEDE
jgi:hypothetical protein